MTAHEIYSRKIEWVRSPKINIIGPGHQNRWLLEPGNWKEYDPFLVLAEDWFEKGSFGKHPHRGMETVTYVIEGTLEHFDSSGNKDSLMPGDAQWMTAGRGVIHLEDPAPGETVHSLQLWVNLPSKDKMADPGYQNLRRRDVPTRTEPGVIVRVFSGSSGNAAANTKNYTPVTMVECTVESGSGFRQDLPGSYNGFLFVVEGEGKFGAAKTQGKQGDMMWIERGTAGQASDIHIEAMTDLRVLLYAGEPIGEPVVARGPFVMNTQEQILQAFRDYQEGKFA